MENIKLTVSGAAGRMGVNLIRAIDEHPNVELSGALVRNGSNHVGNDSGELAGIGKNDVRFTDDIDDALKDCDGVIDFSLPAATIQLLKKTAEYKRFHVIGTTGFTEDEDRQIENASNSAAILKSGNMSVGVNLLAILVEQAASALKASEFDIEVLEMHHRRKIDAPSGTALLLGQAAATGRKVDLIDHSVRSRDGITGTREEGTIGFATLRGGGVIGNHSVIFASERERIELQHVAQDRTLFATGAVDAAIWTSGQPDGLYSMRDVLGI